jgi:dipeptidyl aminopeptidase/acylaminoacyl peptidase
MKAIKLSSGILVMFLLLFLFIFSIVACNSTIEPNNTSAARTVGSPSETPSQLPSVTDTLLPVPTITETIRKTVAPSITSTPTREITSTKLLPAAGNLIFLNQRSELGKMPDGIYMIRFPDLKPTVIVPKEEHSGLQVHPSLSPDGKWIVFSSTDRLGNYDLYIIGSDGKGLRRLTYGGYSDYPSWSPDGNWIAYSALNNIFIIHPDGSGAEGLTSGPGNKRMPVWSPDGRYIAYINNPTELVGNFDFNLQVLDMQTRKSYTLVEGVREYPFGGNLSWSLDSKKIYFTKAEDCANLYMIDNKEGAAPLPVDFPTGNLEGISWSPDGKWMSYIVSRDSKNCFWAGTQMFIAPVDGSYAVEILDSSAFDPVQPAWAPLQ